MRESTVLYLHIGINKTGTSAIQRFLASNPDALRRSGVLYPATGRSADAHYGISRALGFAHGRGRAPDSPAAGKLAAALAAERARSGCSTLILSSEDFVIPADPAAVRDFLKDYDTRIVVYLRRHDHWWLSAWNQAVRMVADPPWPGGGVGRYVRFQRARHGAYGDFRALLERWSAVFGRERMLVRPFEPLQNPRGIVADFLETVGLSTLAPLAQQADARVNESAGCVTLHLLDMVQRARISEALRDRVKAALLAETEQGPREIERIMKPSLRQRLVAENRADYAWIARTYLGRADGLLFREPDPDPDAPWHPPELPDTADIVERVLHAADTA